MSEKIRDIIVEETWNLQDGYGEQGFMPTQGWDWSGIRDSSDEAIINMANNIRRILNKYQVIIIRVEDTIYPEIDLSNIKHK